MNVGWQFGVLFEDKIGKYKILIMKKYLPLLCLALCGCNFGQRTQIAWLDDAYTPASKNQFALLNQPIKTHVEIYRDGQKPDRPYHEIALMAVDGNGNEEPAAVQGFINLGDRIGADAVIIDPAFNAEGGTSGKLAKTNDQGESAAAGTTSTYILLPNQRCDFRALAVVWATNKSNGK